MQYVVSNTTNASATNAVTSTSASAETTTKYQQQMSEEKKNLDWSPGGDLQQILVKAKSHHDSVQTNAETTKNNK